MTEKKYEVASIYKKALEKIETAQLLLKNLRNDDAVSRAYYAVFHGISAVLLSKGIAFSSHSQVIGVFNREFVKTGVFPADFSKRFRLCLIAVKWGIILSIRQSIMNWQKR